MRSGTRLTGLWTLELRRTRWTMPSGFDRSRPTDCRVIVGGSALLAHEVADFTGTGPTQDGEEAEVTIRDVLHVRTDEQLADLLTTPQAAGLCVCVCVCVWSWRCEVGEGGGWVAWGPQCGGVGSCWTSAYLPSLMSIELASALC
jgi:hypothetical protein